MNHLCLRAGLALVLALHLSQSIAEEGVERAVGGVRETVTSPGKVFEGISDETRDHGAVGVVTGSLKGGAKAAGQAVKGAADIGVGVVEAITEPLRD
ncbi:MAG: hypothetical protein RLW62_17530 [Gammaproteobacteria bacterium]